MIEKIVEEIHWENTESNLTRKSKQYASGLAAVLRAIVITKPPANPADGPAKQRKDEYVVKA